MTNMASTILLFLDSAISKREYCDLDTWWKHVIHDISMIFRIKKCKVSDRKNIIGYYPSHRLRSFKLALEVSA